MTKLSNEQQAAIIAAAEKLVRCKGRYHSEQNYRALAALFGVTMPDLPPLAAEAQEPVAWRWFHLNQWHVTNDEGRARDLAWDGVKVMPLYAAPQPVAVPDDDKTNMLCDSAYVNGLQAGFSMGQMNQEAEYAQTVELYRKGIRDYRAAMLNAEPVSQPYKLPQWIPCSERMPEDGQHVIIFCDGAFVISAQYRDGDFFDVVRDGEEFFETVSRCVTHWMPLPATPQEPTK